MNDEQAGMIQRALDDFHAAVINALVIDATPDWGAPLLDSLNRCEQERIRAERIFHERIMRGATP